MNRTESKENNDRNALRNEQESLLNMNGIE